MCTEGTLTLATTLGPPLLGWFSKHIFLQISELSPCIFSKIFCAIHETNIRQLSSHESACCNCDTYFSALGPLWSNYSFIYPSFFFISQSSCFIKPVVQRTHEPPNNAQSLRGDQSKCWNDPGPKLKQHEQVHEHIPSLAQRNRNLLVHLHMTLFFPILIA